MSLERIAAAFGTSARTLTLHAKKEGWVRLVGTKRLRPGRKPRAPGEPKPKRATVDEVRRRDMVRRLLEALDKRLTLLETRMAPDAENGGVAQSAADAERDARTLSGLARLYAKLVELDDAARAGGKPGQDKSVAKLEATDVRTDSAAILRSAFSDSIRLGTLETFLAGLSAGELARLHFDFELWGARRSIAAFPRGRRRAMDHLADCQ